MLPERALASPIVNLVSPFQPGGPVDATARVLSDELLRQKGVASVVTYKPGAAGLLAAQEVAYGPPARPRLLIMPSALWLSSLFPEQETVVTALSRLRPLCGLARQGTFLVASNQLGVASLEAFVQRAGAADKPLTCGIQGVGSAPHLMAVSLALEIGSEVVPVPYQGSSSLVLDLIQGRIDFAFLTFEAFNVHLQRNAVRPLAVASANRSRRARACPGSKA
jgi:tripartite-type tricarboxylate transporter receptor subunit TctC